MKIRLTKKSKSKAPIKKAGAPKKPSRPTKPKATTKTKKRTIPKNAPTRDSFEELILRKSHTTPLVVQFAANWCGPCRVLKPIMNKLSKEAAGKWVFLVVDVEKQPQMAAQNNVRSLPDVRMYHKGEQIASFQGAKPSHVIQSWLDNNLPKKRKSKKHADINLLLRNNKVDAAKTRLLSLLQEADPTNPIPKLLLALETMDDSNPQAMQWINQVDKRGEFGVIAKHIRDMIEMKSDEKDAGTPTNSPYNPNPTSANARINLKNFNDKLLEHLVLDMVNNLRNQKGLKDLSTDRILTAAANDQNTYQIKKDILSHNQNNLRKKTVNDRVVFFGGKFKYVGENVQYQGLQISQWNNQVQMMTETYLDAAKKIVANWIHSPDHYRNLMNPRFKEVGTSIGWNPENSALFATQVYGG